MERETPREISEKIGNGHAYRDHLERHNDFNDPRRGQPLGIQTREQLISHLHQTITDRHTQCFTTQHGHDLYYNKGTNTFVAHDPESPDRGTCYRPTAKEQHFNRAFDHDVNEHNGSPDPSRIKTGGYYGLHPEVQREAAPARENQATTQEQQREQTITPENEAKHQTTFEKQYTNQQLEESRERQENLSETSRGQREREAAYEQEAQEKQREQEKDKEPER